MKGSIKTIEKCRSQGLENTRSIYIYLPTSYYLTSRSYPVIFMHDGQNLFDDIADETANWQVNRVADSLADDGLEVIIVGIPNTEDERWNEYSPFKEEGFGGGAGDKYIEFLLRRVKPLIDDSFRTDRRRENTGIIGSSMGGLLSLYAFFTYPKYFGFVGAMSPSLWFGGDAIFTYIEKSIYVPGKIYLDVGKNEFAENDLWDQPKRHYVGNARRMSHLLQRKGYEIGKNLKFVEDDNGIHHESAWGRRLPGALHFLIP